MIECDFLDGPLAGKTRAVAAGPPTMLRVALPPDPAEAVELHEGGGFTLPPIRVAVYRLQQFDPQALAFGYRLHGWEEM